jgi:TPR repeat protein
LAFDPWKKRDLANEKSIFVSREMASSSSHNNNCIPLATLLEWYKIRDTFFGHNFVSQNVPLAIEMAASCNHPDARWLAEACAGKDVTTGEDAKRVFSSLVGQNDDARALCFAWRLGMLVEQKDIVPLLRSAELGFAFAQAWMAWKTEGEEKFKFAQLAAAQGEREGLFWLGWCFRYGQGCEMDLDKAKENFLRASELGDVSTMSLVGEMLNQADPHCWQWRGRGQLVDLLGALCSSLVNKSSCSILALEVLLSCLRLDELCKVM